MTRYDAYIAALRQPFTKLARLRFLNPDGSTAFAVDNNARNTRSGAFLADGSVSMRWGNGRRRSADVTLANADGAFDYNVNQAWFGTEIALDEGLILPDGTDFYLPQGVFLIESPEERLEPARRTITYHLTDKTANLDGGLLGVLDTFYEIGDNEAIFPALAALLRMDRGNGSPVDRIPPIFTHWYDGKETEMPDETMRPMTNTLYKFRVEAGGTQWDIFEGLCGMFNAWAGYDETGALRVDPSQDDILDSDKPIDWNFSMGEATLLGAAYTAQNTEVYNDVICVGERLSDGRQAYARAQNLDPASDTNVLTVGRKTKIVQSPKYAADSQCADDAEWILKRVSVLQKAVSISCSQLFHITGNDLVTLARTDRPGNPVERHLVTGFSRPITGTGEMKIEAVSTVDFPIATVTEGF